jgi:hypothetical protein
MMGRDRAEKAEKRWASERNMKRRSEERKWGKRKIISRKEVEGRNEGKQELFV